MSKANRLIPDAGPGGFVKHDKLQERIGFITKQKNDALRRVEQLQECQEALAWLFKNWDEGMDAETCFTDCPFDLEILTAENGG